MHEFASVETFVKELTKKIPPSAKVKALRFRRGNTFSEEAVRLAFNVHAKGTLLERVDLHIEKMQSAVRCSCGYQTHIDVEEPDGNPVECPRCHDLLYIHHGPDLELLDIVYEAAPFKGR